MSPMLPLPASPGRSVPTDPSDTVVQSDVIVEGAGSIPVTRTALHERWMEDIEKWTNGPQL